MRIFRKPTLSLSFFFFVFFLLYESSMAADTIRRDEFLRDGLNHKPLVSPRKTFELGFFSPGSSTRRYLGIWYGNIEDKAVVWVANRENPILDTSGVLRISNDGNLVLLNGQNITVWSSNIESSSNNNNRIGAIRDTGNFELIEVSSERAIWESFDHPTDTFLPQMRVRVNPQTGDNLAFVSWRSETDPSPGNYTLGIDPSGAPEIVLWGRNKTRKWRSGQWNSAIFTGIPNMSLLTNYLYGFKLSSPPDETGSVYFTYVPSDPSVLLRFKVLHNGTEEELRWNETLKRWTKFQSEPDTECDKYNRCGKFGICDMKGSNGICSCVKGYEPVSVGDWSRGCRRRTPLKCERNTSAGEDEFLTLKSVKLPDFETPEHSLVDPEDCKDRCLRNCSCAAFTVVNGIGCMIWNQDLVDLQQFEAGGSSLHVRLADSEIGESKKSKIVVIVAVLVGVILLGLFVLLLWRFKRKKDVSGAYCGKNTDTSVVVVDMTKTKETTTAFTGSAWYLYTHGRSEELVDPKIRVTCNKREALRCIHVAMLCVQDSAAERPNMAAVLLMLESDTSTLAVPRQPTFTSNRRNSIDVNFALDSSQQYIVSSNEITSTVVLGR
ncbi:unnamed protein product [Thlaspi arvense]|uniref:Uncharacterized protein n=1 Tax=Thlaspi arvense TaxID=13288 RepID=A0AAU9T313_THLAR|nr:unnamed protein product [Thlaspi arvense]